MMRETNKKWSWRQIGAAVFSMVLAGAGLWSGLASAQDGDPYAPFREYSETKKVRLNYQTLDYILGRAVLRVGKSHRFSPDIKEERTATRLSLRNRSPSWLEANRLGYHLLGSEQAEALREHRQTLERLPEAIPGGFARLTRDQQLAYWLNLYTVTVIEQIAEVYPIEDLRRMLRGRRSIKDEKMLNVLGVDLSLDDIQNAILIPIWDDPLVIYGLYQGAIGGPNIQRKAYMDDNVWQLLEANARDFVNSIRGIRQSGDDAELSEFYEWTWAAFPEGMDSLRAHILKYADDETRAIITGADRLEIDYFDWNIADIFNGKLRDERSSATFVSGGGGDSFSTGGAVGVVDNPFVSQVAGGNAAMNTLFTLGGQSVESMTPQHVVKFVQALEMKFQTYGVPEGVVEIEEVEAGDDAQ